MANAPPIKICRFDIYNTPLLVKVVVIAGHDNVFP